MSTRTDLSHALDQGAPNSHCHRRGPQEAQLAPRRAERPPAHREAQRLVRPAATAALGGANCPRAESGWQYGPQTLQEPQGLDE